MSDEGTHSGPVVASDSEDLVFKSASDMTHQELREEQAKIILDSDEANSRGPSWARLQEPLLRTATACEDLQALALKGRTHTRSITADGSEVFTFKELGTALSDRELPDYKDFLKPRTRYEPLKFRHPKTEVELREEVTRLKAEVDARVDAENEAYSSIRDVFVKYDSARKDLDVWLANTWQKTDEGFTPTMVALAAAGRGGLGATVSKDWKGNLTVDP